MAYDRDPAGQTHRGAFFRCFLASFLLVLVAAGACFYFNAVDRQLFETALLENVQGADEAAACAQRILTAFDSPLRLDDRVEFTITPSIGISLFPEHAQVPTDLLKYADTAMYHAKAAGKHSWMCYTDSMAVDLRRRAYLTTH